MTHFNEMYDIFYSKQDTLCTASIVNIAELQSIVKTAQDTMTKIQENLAKLRADNVELHALVQNTITQKQHFNYDTLDVANM